MTRPHDPVGRLESDPIGRPLTNPRPPPAHVVADSDAGSYGAVAEEDPAERGTATSDPVRVVAGGQAPGGVEREARDVGPSASRVARDARAVDANAGVTT